MPFDLKRKGQYIRDKTERGVQLTASWTPEEQLKKVHLQRDGGTIEEGRRDLLIEVDHEVLLDGDLSVPLLDPLVNPGLKVVADDGEDQVHEVLLGQLLHLLGRREVREHLLVVHDLLPDQSAGECVILGEVQKFHPFNTEILNEKEVRNATWQRRENG